LYFSVHLFVSTAGFRTAILLTGGVRTLNVTFPVVYERLVLPNAADVFGVLTVDVPMWKRGALGLSEEASMEKSLSVLKYLRDTYGGCFRALEAVRHANMSLGLSMFFNSFLFVLYLYACIISIFFFF
jgi:hypothetical protein